MKDPKKRLSDAKAIKAHKWFSKINWEDAENRRLKVVKPIIP